LTMTAVCASAGLTERYFYESFRNRDALLTSIFDEVSDEWFTVLRATLAPPDREPGVIPTSQELRERASAGLGVIVDALTADPRKARLFTEAMGHDALRRRRTERLGELAALLSELLQDTFELRDPRQLERLKLAMLVIVGGMADAGASWLSGEIALSREDFIDESARLCVAAAETIRATP
ncbi:MAG: TetR/AcrR family transcriptional regulator, partial [Micromonosporaceae bacterium]